MDIYRVEKFSRFHWDFLRKSSQIFVGKTKDHLHTTLNKSNISPAFRILWRREGQVFYTLLLGQASLDPASGLFPFLSMLPVYCKRKNPFCGMPLSP